MSAACSSSATAPLPPTTAGTRAPLRRDLSQQRNRPMHDFRDDTTLGRRDLLARLAGVALAATGLSALRRFSQASAIAAPPKWDDRFELAVDLEIAPQQGYRYHRPYVVVWVEDANGKPVRTLSAWVNTSGRGPRYIRELRRWFSMERDQQDAGGPDLIATISSA